MDESAIINFKKFKDLFEGADTPEKMKKRILDKIKQVEKDLISLEKDFDDITEYTKTMHRLIMQNAADGNPEHPSAKSAYLVYWTSLQSKNKINHILKDGIKNIKRETKKAV